MFFGDDVRPPSTTAESPRSRAARNDGADVLVRLGRPAQFARRIYTARRFQRPIRQSVAMPMPRPIAVSEMIPQIPTLPQ
jgi:hypothetical protein